MNIYIYIYTRICNTGYYDDYLWFDALIDNINKQVRHTIILIVLVPKHFHFYFFYYHRHHHHHCFVIAIVSFLCICTVCAFILCFCAGLTTGTYAFLSARQSIRINYYYYYYYYYVYCRIIIAQSMSVTCSRWPVLRTWRRMQKDCVSIISREEVKPTQVVYFGIQYTVLKILQNWNNVGKIVLHNLFQ